MRKAFCFWTDFYFAEWSQRDLDRNENVKFCRQYIVFHDEKSVVYSAASGNCTEIKGEYVTVVVARICCMYTDETMTSHLISSPPSECKVRILPQVKWRPWSESAKSMERTNSFWRCVCGQTTNNCFVMALTCIPSAPLHFPPWGLKPHVTSHWPFRYGVKTWRWKASI